VQPEMVAGACYTQLLRHECSRCVFANVVIRFSAGLVQSRGHGKWQRSRISLPSTFLRLSLGLDFRAYLASCPPRLDWLPRGIRREAASWSER